ncbi:hypothetical protein B1759_14405 [Rubrivirga sp. SAORIC476]|uniref:LCCL domain-containing protein n=1 Tax=Rubrivirga sp. SAORIC476 TaxID=1961794 RepID=UPI000BDD0A2C|nr:LCCL domain-containing protein [Rubrivirga sp. SAORIC476]PAP79512.1 hypothetical protein B1759_14405 [Rubrivirga sp. SAORIC476]
MRFLTLLCLLVLVGCSAASDAVRSLPGTPTPSTPPAQTFEYDVLHGAADWDTQVSDYRGRNGDIVAFDCQGDPNETPPSGAGAVYGGGADGRGLFTDDSRVCWAGVFAGAIPRTGGRLYVEVRPEADTFPGGYTRNAVSTVDWPSYEGGGFVVLGAR